MSDDGWIRVSKRTRYQRVLGVSELASEVEVRKKYHSLIREWHPDKFCDDMKQRRHAEQKLAEINIAYREYCEAQARH